MYLSFKCKRQIADLLRYNVKHEINDLNLNLT